MSREIFFKIELVLLFNIKICLCCLPVVLQNHIVSFVIVTHKIKNVNCNYKLFQQRSKYKYDSMNQQRSISAICRWSLCLSELYQTADATHTSVLSRERGQSVGRRDSNSKSGFEQSGPRLTFQSQIYHSGPSVQISHNLLAESGFNVFVTKICR